MRLSLFKLPRYRSFQYTPRYYDQDKEERTERNARIKEEVKYEQGLRDKGEYVSNLRGKFRRELDHADARRGAYSNIRLVVIIMALSALASYVFYF